MNQAVGRVLVRGARSAGIFVHCCILLGFLLGSLPGGMQLSAQEELPLYELDPYDEITLDEANGSATLKLVPLELPDRRPPAQPRPDELLPVQLFAQPERRFQVAWKHIIKLRLYEQILLEEAERLAVEGRFDAAYGYYDYLLARHADWPGVEESVQKFLINDAFAAFQGGDLLRAWALLAELHRRNPQRAGLAGAVERVGRKRFGDYLQAEDYSAAGALLQTIERIYGSSQAKLVESCREALAARARELRDGIRARLAASEPREAAALARELRRVDAASPPSRAAWEAAQRAWPRVVVGVTEPFRPECEVRISRRWDRLEGRRLLEAESLAAEGLIYSPPWGEVGVAEDRRGLEWRGGDAVEDPLLAFRVATMLRGDGEVTMPHSLPLRRFLLEHVELRGAEGVAARLLRPHARLEALFAEARWPDKLGLSPYTPQVLEGGKEVSWLRVDDYRLASADAPREILEHTYPDSSSAAQALLRGEVDVVDRLWPRDAARLASAEELVVQPYALPAVHVLTPRGGHRLLEQRRYRRALLHALSRESLLREQLASGAFDPSAQVAVIPLPSRFASESPTLIPYEPRLAMALIGLVDREIRPADAGEELVLGGPPDPTVQTLLASIQAQWAAAGIPSRLAIDDPTAVPTLFYECWTVREPVTELRPLLERAAGEGRIAPALDQSLRAFEEAESLTRSRQALLELLHALAEEVPVLPLWQLGEFHAFSKGLKGIGPQPLELYQGVEEWRLSLPEASP